jgi:hypothetical protein
MSPLFSLRNIQGGNAWAGKTNLLGQTTRQTIPGKNMSFELAPGLFGGKSPAAGLHVRVGYFDEGHGSWALYYAASPSSGGGMKRAALVQKQDSGEFVEVRLRLSDLDLGRAGDRGGQVHFALADPDAVVGGGGGAGEIWTSPDPDVFAWVEVLSSPFLYAMAEVVHDLGAVVVGP